MAVIKKIKLYKVVADLPPELTEDRPEEFKELYRLTFSAHPTFERVTGDSHIEVYKNSKAEAKMLLVDQRLHRYETVGMHTINPADYNTALFYYEIALPRMSQAVMFNLPLHDNVKTYFLELDAKNALSLIELPLKLVKYINNAK